MSYDTSFITSLHEKTMIDSAIQAVSNLELWSWLKDVNTDSFMFSNDPNVMRIYNEIERIGYNSHSGASFGCTMRNIEFIAKHSFDEYRLRHLRVNVENISLPLPPTRNQSRNSIYIPQ